MVGVYLLGALKVEWGDQGESSGVTSFHACHAELKAQLVPDTTMNDMNLAFMDAILILLWTGFIEARIAWESRGVGGGSCHKRGRGGLTVLCESGMKTSPTRLPPPFLLPQPIHSQHNVSWCRRMKPSIKSMQRRGHLTSRQARAGG